MQAVYEIIFSFSGGYNYLNQQVCSGFKRLAPKVSVYVYLDQLLQDGKKDEFTLFVCSTPMKEITEVAIEQTQLSLLAECVENIPANICDIAARKGDLKLLLWTRERKYYWNECTYLGAACNGHLEVIKWLREQGCPWDEWTCSRAAVGGHLEVLQWAHENGCPCSNATLQSHLGSKMVYISCKEPLQRPHRDF